MDQFTPETQAFIKANQKNNPLKLKEATKLKKKTQRSFSRGTVKTGSFILAAALILTSCTASWKNDKDNKEELESTPVVAELDQFSEENEVRKEYFADIEAKRYEINKINTALFSEEELKENFTIHEYELAENDTEIVYEIFSKEEALVMDWMMNGATADSIAEMMFLHGLGIKDMDFFIGNLEEKLITIFMRTKVEPGFSIFYNDTNSDDYKIYKEFAEARVTSNNNPISAGAEKSVEESVKVRNLYLKYFNLSAAEENKRFDHDEESDSFTPLIDNASNGTKMLVFNMYLASDALTNGYTLRAGSIENDFKYSEVWGFERKIAGYNSNIIEIIKEAENKIDSNLTLYGFINSAEIFGNSLDISVNKVHEYLEEKGLCIAGNYLKGGAESKMLIVDNTHLLGTIGRAFTSRTYSTGGYGGATQSGRTSKPLGTGTGTKTDPIGSNATIDAKMAATDKEKEAENVKEKPHKDGLLAYSNGNFGVRIPSFVNINYDNNPSFSELMNLFVKNELTSSEKTLYSNNDTFRSNIRTKMREAIKDYETVEKETVTKEDEKEGTVNLDNKYKAVDTAMAAVIKHTDSATFDTTKARNLLATADAAMRANGVENKIYGSTGQTYQQILAGITDKIQTLETPPVKESEPEVETPPIVPPVVTDPDPIPPIKEGEGGSNNGEDDDFLSEIPTYTEPTAGGVQSSDYDYTDYEQSTVGTEASATVQEYFANEDDSLEGETLYVNETSFLTEVADGEFETIMVVQHVDQLQASTQNVVLSQEEITAATDEQGNLDITNAYVNHVLGSDSYIETPRVLSITN